MKENGKLIVSLFDKTLQWVQPFINAGYAVIPWDLSHEGNILENDAGIELLMWKISEAIEAGYQPFGLLGAPPCTRYTVSSNRHRAESRTKIIEVDKGWFMTEMEMYNLLTSCYETIREYMERIGGRPLQFHALENPIGVIETECPWIKEYPVKWKFDPCDFGDPYTKKTVLWGDYKIPQYKTPTLFVIPEYIHNMAPGPDRSAKRSVTPKGFAQAFYQANK